MIRHFLDKPLDKLIGKALLLRLAFFARYTGDDQGAHDTDFELEEHHILIKLSKKGFNTWIAIHE